MISPAKSLSFHDATEELLSHLESGSRRTLIALAGLPGSGKSTLAARLASHVNAFAGREIMMALGMDGFHLTRARLAQMPDSDAAFARRGAPWTFDVPALTARLRQLRATAGSEVVEWPDFDHAIGDPMEGAYQVAPEVKLVLIEGLYLLHSSDGWGEVEQLFDERWYLDTPLAVAMERLTQRHMSAWNITREEATRRIACNDRLNAAIVASSQGRAKLIAGN